ncbi:hypothetical protein SDC9_46952 [bioreactor metagenome]|uniref:ATPase AAA-type core domain-containing protein n=1 Tax=bioreactor metagenome TaxID=1076179 RepID=A0A644WAF1_9ZZZZ
MKIKELKFYQFKRFTDLTITNIPSTAKLVVLVGPNGSGKTSVFEGINSWYKRYGFGNVGDLTFYEKVGMDKEKPFNWEDNIKLITHENITVNSNKIKSNFYFRTAYRNEPDFTTTNLSRQDNPTNQIRFDNLMRNDQSVSTNYQRLISKTLSGVYDSSNNGKTVEAYREELVGKIKRSISSVFPDLQLSSIGDPLTNGSFYFEKGISKDYHYKNLSAGEKAAFDLLLDLIIKSEYYPDAVLCIDEPEIHMHTRLQSKLLDELYELIPSNSQLWISTHSIGMLNKAKDLNERHPGSVVFLNFDNIDFDAKAVIEPSRIDKTIWNRFLDLAFDDFSKLLTPRTIIFCEGTPRGRKYKDFDAQIYDKIFSNTYPDVSFVSVGSCNDIENDNPAFGIISKIAHSSKIIKVVDRDDKSGEEIEECKRKYIRVLNKRHIESYLLDDEIIICLCEKLSKGDKIDDCLTLKETKIQESVARKNPSDDIKSAGGEIYIGLKKILELKQCGNNLESFLRDTITPLITPDTAIYKELEKEILLD